MFSGFSTFTCYPLIVSGCSAFLLTSLQEKPPITSFHQIESSSETQSFITESNSYKPKPKTIIRTTSKVKETLPVELKAVEPCDEEKPLKTLNLLKIDDGSDITEQKKSGELIWSRDASPSLPPKSLDASFTIEESSLLPAKSLNASFTIEESSLLPAKPLDASFTVKSKDSLQLIETNSLKTDVSKGAVKKTFSNKSSQNEDVKITVEKTVLEVEHNPPSKALLQKLAMVETEPRKKIKPSEEMLSALKVINDSLLKKMGAKPFSSSNLKTAKATIQQEWFHISSQEKANPHEVEDYLDYFEELSVPMLEYCVNMVDSNGNTAMHYAVSHANFDIVSILLDSKVCNVNQMNNAGYTCVMLVSLAKLKNAAHRTVVERLFQMADVNIRAKKHCQTALMLAVSHGNSDMVHLLLVAGADINIQDEDGSTALMCAAEHGRVDIVKQLLSHPDCDSLKEDVDGATAFKIAWQAGHRDVGLLLYIHEQVLRSKLPNREESIRTSLTSMSDIKKSPPPK